jgi:enolase-phosphatase E1
LTRAILTDIEGTTTSLSFVHDVLFPYARKALPAFIRAHQNDTGVKEHLDALREQQGRYLTEQQIIDVLGHRMDEDRKDAVLKALQGMVWCSGYEQGDFTGHVYEDAACKLREWHDSGMVLAIFSSGSVPAQKLLFGYSDYGDLTPLFSHYFDTRTGAKREPGAYKTIAGDMGMPPPDILFLSDVIEELNAARAAGMRTTQLVREGQATTDHPVAKTFDEVVI